MNVKWASENARLRAPNGAAGVAAAAESADSAVVGEDGRRDAVA